MAFLRIIDQRYNTLGFSEVLQYTNKTNKQKKLVITLLTFLYIIVQQNTPNKNDGEREGTDMHGPVTLCYEQKEDASDRGVGFPYIRVQRRKKKKM